MGAAFANVWEYAAEFPGVTEGICYGTPALYVGRKLMARMWEDGETLVLKLPMENRAHLLETEPDVYFLTDHYRNYPAILVNLLAISRPELRAAVEVAWRQVGPAKLQKAVAPHGFEP